MSSYEDRIAARRKNFKKTQDNDDARRKREEEAIQLRKQQKEQALQKKRNINVGPNSTAGSISAGYGGAQTSSQISPEVFMQMVNNLRSPDAVTQFQVTQQFRKLLSIETSPPIQEVINAGVVKTFVEFLKDESRPELQFEAAWVLTNIASGTCEQTRHVVDNQALPIFVQLLRSPNDDVREQAVWALGNIAGDSPQFRDQVLHANGLDPLVDILTTSAKTSMLRNATWTLSNLCRGKPAVQFQYVEKALCMLEKLINLQSPDREIITDACWALSYLSDGDNERITAVIKAGVVRRLVLLLDHENELVQTPALRAVGNIVTGDDMQTEAAIRKGCLDPMLNLLKHRKKGIRKETCWTISNVTAGSREQIQAVIAQGLIPPVIQCLKNDDFEVKKEAAWAISNATTGGSHEQVQYLVEEGCIPPLCDLLSSSDAKIVPVALDALDNILKVGVALQGAKGLESNPYCAKVEEADGLSKIEALQHECSHEIYQKASYILPRYWEVDEDSSDNGGDMAADAQPNFNFAP